jgi:hypothetical protein
MYNPKKILTEDGYTNLFVHVKNMENALFYILNHADDLHIGSLDDEQLEILYKLQEMITGDSPLLLNGDGE